ncbi:MAG: heavy metal-binding domain-containing protein [Leptolyngbyaceae cyanobacterium MO_188.B28]|nr:heavy metal-binding domain-containing protein [Leptolyngbyaceae cyanobacterium MO_188.B28]
MELLVFLTLLTLGYFVGLHLERRHFEDIKRREHKTLFVPIANFGAKQPLPTAQTAQLFMGSVVVSTDYFKSFTASLRNLVGGRIVVYESLLDRGRREALLRMKEQAIAAGATQIVNVRLETSNIGSQTANNGMVAIEVIAYGTGIR